MYTGSKPSSAALCHIKPLFSASMGLLFSRAHHKDAHNTCNKLIANTISETKSFTERRIKSRTQNLGAYILRSGRFKMSAPRPAQSPRYRQQVLSPPGCVDRPQEFQPRPYPPGQRHVRGLRIDSTPSCANNATSDAQTQTTN
jgi:hypothetical protein